MHSGKIPPFQSDANFGLGAAVLAMLVVDIEEAGAGTRRWCWDRRSRRVGVVGGERIEGERGGRWILGGIKWEW